MDHLVSVSCSRDQRFSHWVAKAPAGRTVEWDAEIINDIPDELIAWRTLGGADVVSAGSVRFKPAAGGRGTEVRVKLQYDPPAGKVGATVAWLLGDEPSQVIREDLRRFKQLMETGEMPTATGTGQPTRDDGMKALVWHGTNDVRVERVPDPKILNPRDAIVKITTTAICGSDLHLLDGFIPTMQAGDILGHEFMGEVVEVGTGQHEAEGRRPRRRAVHDRLRQLLLLRAAAVVALRQLEPQRGMAEKLYGYAGVGAVRLLAHDRRLRRRTGAVRARAVRRRRADQGSRSASPTSRCCSSPTSFRPATWRPRTATSSRGDIVAVWGCGPVGQMAIRSAFLLGAERVIAIDGVPERLRMARGAAAPRRINFDERGRLRAAASADRRARSGRLHRRGRARGARRRRSTPTSTASRPRRSWPPIGRTRCGRRSTRAARAARSRFPASTAGSSTRCRSAPRSEGLTFKMGQTHVMKYLQPLLDRIERGEIDPSFVITHRAAARRGAARPTRCSATSKDECIKVVLKPHGGAHCSLVRVELEAAAPHRVIGREQR